VKFSLKQLTQQGSSEGLCVVSVLAATFTRMSPRRARVDYQSQNSLSTPWGTLAISAIDAGLSPPLAARQKCGFISDSRALR
jgi:hypothetical protein